MIILMKEEKTKKIVFANTSSFCKHKGKRYVAEKRLKISDGLQ